MSPFDSSPLIKLLHKVGRDIVSWRNNIEYRQLYCESNYKTEADQRAHEQISNGISRLYPGVQIFSEESSQPIINRPDLYWLIDPIDGTASWYNGYSGFVTQAALIEKNQPKFGIIYAPLLNNTWTAFEHQGAYLNNVRLPNLEQSKRLIITDNTPDPHGIVKFLSKKLNATGYRESGSLGLKAALVADGTADLFVKDVIVRDWDFAPVAVILREVGGYLGMANGCQYVFSGSFEKKLGIVVARDIKLYEQVIALLSEYNANI